MKNSVRLVYFNLLFDLCMCSPCLWGADLHRDDKQNNKATACYAQFGIASSFPACLPAGRLIAKTWA